MDIYLTNHANVRHTKFCSADGQIMYKSETPGLLHTGKKTTIYKVIPNNDPEHMIDRFTELATIDWRVVKSSTLAYNGVEMPIAIKGIFGRHRIFTAPGDGRLFKWTLGSFRVTLVLNDGSNTVVARGHRSNIGFIGKPRQARLEIFPNFNHLADVILVTYLLTERIRKDRERNRRRG
ncbi:hypothetical protein PILCRDRAFT_819162 [Piloderma croceum F 1598]|uniref:DUF6593 domain-containing protein n=1 Tax=Piloderma croceum (strain F 1598) TaxID=765440 RepID=A0A0C3FVM3_PILCF|nr:hypothetical protein PILCRDRAFT_819162 [Piloderma croceum F 1598]